MQVYLIYFCITFVFVQTKLMNFTSWQHIILTLSAFICGILPASAQFPSWEDFVEQLHSEYSESRQENFESIYEVYAYHHANPININSADSMELKSLDFLTGWQIEGIHYYIHKYGALHSIGELILIPELDYHTRQLLSYFVTFGPTTKEKETWSEEWHRMLARGRHELTTRMDIPFYQQAGYAPRTLSQLESSPSRYYTGNALYHNIRYNYRYRNKVSWGICTEKDAGEPIFNAQQPLPDYISGYLQIGERGILKNLVIGNYRLHFGQGLVINSDFALGKSMLLQGVGRIQHTIKPHRGTSESDYYTGIACTLAWKSWELTTLASYQTLDATLDGAAISTLKTDGYHRTLLERARKGNTRSNLFGAHLGYAAHGLHLGMTTIYQSFNRNFALPTQPYKRYAPQGNSFINASVDYAWHHHKVSLLGETAIDKKGAMATLNMVRFKAIDNLYFTLLHRYYAHDYWALEGQSFSASSDLRGEQGIYLGSEWQPFRRLQVTTYIDAYYFSFLRYQVSAPSYGTDGMVAINYASNNSNLVTLRYRYRLKQRDIKEGYQLLYGRLLNEWTHRLKIQWESSITPTLSFTTQAEGCFVTSEATSAGYMGNIQANYESTFKKHGIRISGGVTAFHTDYATRIYGYERGPLYAYNYSTYHGKGIRSYLLLQYMYEEAPRLTSTIKFASTHYFDRDAIGTGATMINANHKENIQLQVRYTF